MPPSYRFHSKQHKERKKKALEVTTIKYKNNILRDATDKEPKWRKKKDRGKGNEYDLYREEQLSERKRYEVKKKTKLMHFGKRDRKMPKEETENF